MPDQFTRAQKYRTHRQSEYTYAIAQSCDVCGREPAVRHHQDYAKPTDVDWLCEYHHHLAHGRAYAGRTGMVSAALFLLGEGYSKAGAARLLGVPASTMRRWFFLLEVGMVS